MYHLLHTNATLFSTFAFQETWKPLIDAMAEIGFFGYCPCTADSFIFNFAHIPTNSLISTKKMLLSGINNALPAKRNDFFLKEHVSCA